MSSAILRPGPARPLTPLRADLRKRKQQCDDPSHAGAAAAGAHALTGRPRSRTSRRSPARTRGSPRAPRSRGTPLSPRASMRRARGRRDQGQLPCSWPSTAIPVLVGRTVKRSPPVRLPSPHRGIGVITIVSSSPIPTPGARGSLGIIRFLVTLCDKRDLTLAAIGCRSRGDRRLISTDPTCRDPGASARARSRIPNARCPDPTRPARTRSRTADGSARPTRELLLRRCSKKSTST